MRVHKKKCARDKMLQTSCIMRDEMNVSLVNVWEIYCRGGCNVVVTNSWTILATAIISPLLLKSPTIRYCIRTITPLLLLHHHYHCTEFVYIRSRTFEACCEFLIVYWKSFYTINLVLFIFFLCRLLYQENVSSVYF